MVNRLIFRRAFIDTLPIMMGYVTMGFAAGVLMAAKGAVDFAPLWSGLCGFAFVSGTLSFAIVPAFACDYSLLSVALLALGINFRYAFYGFSLVARWKQLSIWKKWFFIHSLADEIYALDAVCPYEGEQSITYSLYNHLLCFAYWVFGTTAGGLIGSALPIPSNGIEFAMTALFLVIFTDQMKGIFKRHD